MVTMCIADSGKEITSLLKGLCAAKKIHLANRCLTGEAEYVLLPLSYQKNCDILLLNTSIFTSSAVADYITIINSDEKISPRDDTPSLLITYGLNSLATITASSITTDDVQTEFFCCLQRDIITLKGKVIEPQEFPIKISGCLSDIHAAMGFAALALVLSFTPHDLSECSFMNF